MTSRISIVPRCQHLVRLATEGRAPSTRKIFRRFALPAQHTARSFAEAASLGPAGGPHSLLLESSEDLQCRNIMCEKLGGPCLCRLALVLSRCTRLRTLSLAKNSLSSLPDGVMQSQTLTELDISSNALTAIPDSLTALENLKELNIALNPLQLSDAALQVFTSLELLTISDGQLSDDQISNLRQAGVQVTVSSLRPP